MFEGPLVQVLAVVLGSACLAFFAFFGAYYLRNRRDALDAFDLRGRGTAETAEDKPGKEKTG